MIRKLVIGIGLVVVVGWAGVAVSGDDNVFEIDLADEEALFEDIEHDLPDVVYEIDGKDYNITDILKRCLEFVRDRKKRQDLSAVPLIYEPSKHNPHAIDRQERAVREETEKLERMKRETELHNEIKALLDALEAKN